MTRKSTEERSESTYSHPANRMEDREEEEVTETETEEDRETTIMEETEEVNREEIDSDFD